MVAYDWFFDRFLFFFVCSLRILATREFWIVALSRRARKWTCSVFHLLAIEGDLFTLILDCLELRRSAAANDPLPLIEQRLSELLLLLVEARCGRFGDCPSL